MVLFDMDRTLPVMTAQATFHHFPVGDELGHRIVVPGMHMCHSLAKAENATFAAGHDEL